jgi:hypothetical protein
LAVPQPAPHQFFGPRFCLTQLACALDIGHTRKLKMKMRL